MPTTKNFTQTTEKKNLFEEIKSHKKEIIVTSVLLGATIAGVLIYKRLPPNELTQIKENMKNSIELLVKATESIYNLITEFC